jgi:hypothetical protein
VIVRLLGLVAVLAVAVGLGSDAIWDEPTMAAAAARPGLARLAWAEATRARTVGASAAGTLVTPLRSRDWPACAAYGLQSTHRAGFCRQQGRAFHNAST